MLILSAYFIFPSTRAQKLMRHSVRQPLLDDPLNGQTTATQTQMIIKMFVIEDSNLVVEETNTILRYFSNKPTKHFANCDFKEKFHGYKSRYNKKAFLGPLERKKNRFTDSPTKRDRSTVRQAEFM